MHSVCAALIVIFVVVFASSSAAQPTSSLYSYSQPQLRERSTESDDLLSLKHDYQNRFFVTRDLTIADCENDKDKELLIELETTFGSDVAITVEKWKTKKKKFKTTYEINKNDLVPNEAMEFKHCLKKKKQCYLFDISVRIGRGSYKVKYDGDTIVKKTKFKDGYDNQVEFNKC